MTAGLRDKIDVIRMASESDDVVGGSQLTGTLVCANVRASVTGRMPSQILLEQGLETNKIFEAIVHPGTLDIRERDEVRVVFPPNHVFINQRFRVTGVNYSDFHPSDRRNYLTLSLERSEQAHANQ